MTARKGMIVRTWRATATGMGAHDYPRSVAEPEAPAVLLDSDRSAPHRSVLIDA